MYVLIYYVPVYEDIIRDDRINVFFLE